jgi:hypothetical protein
MKTLLRQITSSAAGFDTLPVRVSLAIRGAGSVSADQVISARLSQ